MLCLCLDPVKYDLHAMCCCGDVVRQAQWQASEFYIHAIHVKSRHLLMLRKNHCSMRVVMH